MTEDTRYPSARAMALVFDIGLHNGDDTAYYLRLGHDVVGIEANPTLVEQARILFGEEISTGALQLLNVGISDSAGPRTFWINERNNGWSSFIREVGCRDSTPCTPVEVECLPITAIIERWGVPEYMKIDIEGNDVHCLRGLTQLTVPKYISVEAHRLEYLILLYNLGYRDFKCVDQTDHNWAGRPTGVRVVDALRRRASRRFRRPSDSSTSFSHGSSGPFGEETRGQWKKLETVAYEWLTLQRGKGPLNPHGWYDFHARLTHGGTAH